MAGDAAAVDQWQAECNPFIVCRCRGADGDLSLGFCLATPGQRPRRVAAQASHDQIVRIARPPSLEEVVAAHKVHGPGAFAFREQAEALIRLSASAAEARLDFQVFGSWMWQTLTGDPHVSADSDLDSLIDVPTSAVADRAAAFLQTASAESPFKVDGELSIPCLGEVHWREYLDGGPELLLKSLAAVRMIRRDDLWK